MVDVAIILGVVFLVFFIFLFLSMIWSYVNNGQGRFKKKIGRVKE